MKIRLKAAKRIEGFMRDEELAWLAKQSSRAKVSIEIGCWMGRTTRALADNTRGTVIAIDHWEGTVNYYTKLVIKKMGGPDALYDKWKHNVGRDHLKSRRIIPIRSASADAVAKVQKTFKKLGVKGADFIFIDGDHYYKYVIADINLYLPLLAKGGTFSGHDIHAKHGGVKKAVREVFGKKYKTLDRIWWATRT